MFYLINTAGTVVASYIYDPYGKVLSATGSLVSINPLRYRGYYYDTESGFYYLQSRYYDPQICRFINADSYASTGQDFIGHNMFAYCGNNPIDQSDPTGKFGLLAGIGIGVSAIIGGVIAAVGTVASGGSGWEVAASFAVGAITAGATAAVAAVAATTALATGAVAAITGGIGAVGEVASLAVEYAFHKNDSNYKFNWKTAGVRVAHAAGMGAVGGLISYGLNKIFVGSDEILGTFISGEASLALGGIDFGVRQTISAVSSDTQAHGMRRQKEYLEYAIYN